MINDVLSTMLRHVSDEIGRLEVFLCKYAFEIISKR